MKTITMTTTELPALDTMHDPAFRVVFGDFRSVAVAVELAHSDDAGWCFHAVHEHHGPGLVRSHWRWDTAKVPADLLPYVDAAIRLATRTAPAPNTRQAALDELADSIIARIKATA